MQIIIGRDVSVNTEVVLKVEGSKVILDAPNYPGWMGYREVVDLGTANSAQSFAKIIAKTPVQVLEDLGLEPKGWFVPT